MLTGDAALNALENRIGENEKNRSSYWDQEQNSFSVKADGSVEGASVLGMVSTNASLLHTLVHWALQFPFRRMAGNAKNYRECEGWGRQIASRLGRQFTHDMIRQTLTLAIIREHINFESPDDCNLVIGDGYGVLTSLFLLAAPHRKTILVNLTKPLLLDAVHIRQSVPGVNIALVSNDTEMAGALSNADINLILIQADHAEIAALAPIGIAANVVSMQEMDLAVIAEYFQILRNNPAKKTFFYCCNKLYKKLIDGTEVRFDDYPWDTKDQVLHNSICPWSQWYYTKFPPFWRYRVGKLRIIWHRLASLNKEKT
jgi:hypothetical protein